MHQDEGVIRFAEKLMEVLEEGRRSSGRFQDTLEAEAGSTWKSCSYQLLRNA